VGLDAGLECTVAWYREHRDDVPANDLMQRSSRVCSA
jgi:UDP-glucose 4-epimerase